MIERKILISLITSTEFCRQIKPHWNPHYLESTIGKHIAAWCWEYYDKYKEAPGRNIEGIYIQKIKEGLAEDIAEEIEEDILPDLSEEFVEGEWNLQFQIDQTLQFFQERRLVILANQIKGLVEDNKIEDAENLAKAHRTVLNASSNDLDISIRKEVYRRLKLAFDALHENLIYYPGALGSFWNAQLVRGGFVALMASEKRGKTFMLIDMALRAAKQGRKVAFFQAGDMTEAQQLRRICIYLAKKSDQERYLGEMYEPVKDCIFNQLDTCTLPERECDYGVFEDKAEIQIRKEITKQDLIEAFEDNKEYKPCYNCKKYYADKLGVPWIKKVNVGNSPLELNEAKRLIHRFFIKHSRVFKLSSHANGTLSIRKVEEILEGWKEKDGFVPDVIVTDYADLFSEETKEFRHKQNEIWKGHRALSQTYNALVITATQADADSYEKHTLSLKNFSEDKRKYGHVTSFYALNQDKEGREKAIGLLRINEILIREGENNAIVTVLQNLKRGRPFLGSFLGK